MKIVIVVAGFTVAAIMLVAEATAPHELHPTGNGEHHPQTPDPCETCPPCGLEAEDAEMLEDFLYTLD